MGLETELYALVIGLKEMIDVVLVICILFLIIIILKVIEKGLNLKLLLKEKDRNLFYRKEIEKMANLNEKPEKTLNRINNLVRNFFNEAFGCPYNLEYLELVDGFKKTGKKECISFCRLISEITYSGEEVSKEKINILINMFKKIIEKNKILNPEEKRILEEKSKKEKPKEVKKKVVKEAEIESKKRFSLIDRAKYAWKNYKEKSEEKKLRKSLVS